MKVRGFKGDHSNINYIKKTDFKLNKPNLITMAEKALKYLYTNPVKEHNYECRFSFAPSECPPFDPLIKVDGYIDAIMEGDTELGLMLKNTLDAMELNVFELASDLPARLLLSMIPGYRKSGQ